MRKFIVLLVLFSTAVFAQQKGSFADSRDGKAYKSVKIGVQIWMAENLNYNASGSKCYENKTSYCDKYGRLYNWETAKKSCPSGWHLPSDEEWQVLVDFAGGGDKAGNTLKASNGWDGIDAFGFSALPSGYGSSDNIFAGIGDISVWWSSTETRSQSLIYDDPVVLRNNNNKSGYFSVRCIKDGE
jgi:uncharacterized protein (TIGR02145 family)